MDQVQGGSTALSTSISPEERRAPKALKLSAWCIVYGMVGFVGSDGVQGR